MPPFNSQPKHWTWNVRPKDININVETTPRTNKIQDNCDSKWNFIDRNGSKEQPSTGKTRSIPLTEQHRYQNQVENSFKSFLKSIFSFKSNWKSEMACFCTLREKQAAPNSVCVYALQKICLQETLGRKYRPSKTYCWKYFSSMVKYQNATKGGRAYSYVLRKWAKSTPKLTATCFESNRNHLE